MASIRRIGLPIAGMALIGALLAGCGSGGAKPASSSSSTPASSSSSASSSTPASSSPAANAPTTKTTTPASTAQASTSPSSTPASSGTPQVSFLHQTSNQSFAATVAALHKAVASHGMMVLGSLDQAKVLSQTGLKLGGAEAFFVGNPVAAKKAFTMDAGVASELPMRVYVWVGKGGHTEVGYFQPSALLAAMNPQLGKMMGPMMDKALGGIVRQATGVSTSPAVAGSSPITFIVKSTKESFSNAVAALHKAVASHGMMVLGSLNQAQVLSQTGLRLAGAESFFVGNPVTAKKAFAMNAVVGGELPMRLSVWAGKGGTEIGYFQPSDLLAAMSPQMGKMVGPMMDKALGGIAAQVAAG